MKNKYFLILITLFIVSFPIPEYAQNITGEYELSIPDAYYYLKINQNGSYNMRIQGDLIDDVDTDTGRWVMKNDTITLFSYLQLENIKLMKKVEEEVKPNDTCNIEVYLYYADNKPEFYTTFTVSSNRLKCSPYFDYDSIQNTSSRIGEKTNTDGKAKFYLKQIDTIWLNPDTLNFWKRVYYYVPKSKNSNCFKFYLNITDSYYKCIYTNGELRYRYSDKGLLLLDVPEDVIKKYRNLGYDFLYKRKLK